MYLIWSKKSTGQPLGERERGTTRQAPPKNDMDTTTQTVVFRYENKPLAGDSTPSE
jgi:hypothetical protein